MTLGSFVWRLESSIESSKRARFFHSNPTSMRARPGAAAWTPGIACLSYQLRPKHRSFYLKRALRARARKTRKRDRGKCATASVVSRAGGRWVLADWGLWWLSRSQRRDRKGVGTQHTQRFFVLCPSSQLGRGGRARTRNSVRGILELSSP